MQKPIKKTATKDLETALDRTKKAFKNPKLKPLSITFYGRRREMIEDEIERRRYSPGVISDNHTGE